MNEMVSFQDPEAQGPNLTASAALQRLSSSVTHLHSGQWHGIRAVFIFLWRKREMSVLGRTQSGFVLLEGDFCLTHFEKSLVFGLQPEMKECCQLLLMILVTT